MGRRSKRAALFELGKLPLGVATPVEIQVQDIAPEESQAAQFWASMIPIMLLLWTLTGAFYPAVDLCAGEKERGLWRRSVWASKTRRDCNRETANRHGI